DVCYLLSLVHNEQLVGISLESDSLDRDVIGSDEVSVFLAKYLKRFRHKLLVRDAVFRLEGHKKRVWARKANLSYYLRSGLKLQLDSLLLSRAYFSSSWPRWPVIAWG